MRRINVAVGSKLGSGEPFAERPLYADERTSSNRADWSVSYQPRELSNDRHER